MFSFQLNWNITSNYKNQNVIDSNDITSFYNQLSSFKEIDNFFVDLNFLQSEGDEVISLFKKKHPNAKIVLIRNSDNEYNNSKFIRFIIYLILGLS